MPYYDTIEDDLRRAKAILAEGKGEPVQLPPGTDGPLWTSGTIYGKDIYAAYKLLESFVTEIERLQQIEQRVQKLNVLLDTVKDALPDMFLEARVSSLAEEVELNQKQNRLQAAVDDVS
jgi:hypothetical protein